MFYIYGIYDKIHGEYIELFVCKSRVEARSVVDGMVNYSSSVVRSFPNDFKIDEIMYISDSDVRNNNNWHSDSSIVLECIDYVRKEKKDEIQK